MMKWLLSFSLVLICFFFRTSLSFGEEAVEVSGYAGSESCLDCHDEIGEDFEKTIHGNKAHPRTPASKRGCESCHGPMAKHADEGDGSFAAVVFGKMSETPTGEQSAACLTCHSGKKLALWQGSPHESRDLSCSSCHSGHSNNPKNLNKPTESELCLQCHKGVRNEVKLTSHHPIREGKMTCSDCHNPHGTIADNLINADTLNTKCFECHAEKRGPFLWEHAPVTEDCSTCHTSHGSAHDKLLTAKRPFLCQRCHSNSRHPGTLYAVPSRKKGESAYNVLNNRAVYRSCSNCHQQVHGSNHPSGKSLSR